MNSQERLWILTKVKPSEYVSHIFIVEGQELSAISDIMINVEGKVMSYESTLRLQDKFIVDTDYEIET